MTKTFNFFVQMQNQWELSSKEWQQWVRSIAREVQKRTDGMQYNVFESIQTICDYIEDTFEPVMLPASKGTEVVLEP